MTASIGIRREDKSEWERRAPLTPDQVRALRETQGLLFRVQPSPHRVFADAEYERAGAIVDESLTACDVIFGIKEIPAEALQPDKAYAFFSHTIKGQAHNMPMLRRLLELKCSLIDYERIADERGRRLIFFGRHAGLAGMLETLCALGKRLAWEGIENPFEDLRRPIEYGDLEEAMAAVRQVGTRIAKNGLPSSLEPLIIGIAGYGNVSRGAQEILGLLPCQEVAPSDLADLFETLRTADHTVYKVVFREIDTVEPIMPCEPFDLQDYYDHPEKYRSRFETYLPYLTVLVNAIYWEPRYPRLVSRQFLRQLYGARKPLLRVIGDISCDIEGAIECTVRPSDPGAPVYVYHPRTGKTTSGVAGEGPVIMAVDILPSELPRDASVAFGEALMPFVPAIARADYGTELEASGLPDEIRRAVICYHGKLAPIYRYLEKDLVPADQGPARDQ